MELDKPTLRNGSATWPYPEPDVDCTYDCYASAPLLVSATATSLYFREVNKLVAPARTSLKVIKIKNSLSPLDIYRLITASPRLHTIDFEWDNEFAEEDDYALTVKNLYEAAKKYGPNELWHFKICLTDVGNFPSGLPGFEAHDWSVFRHLRTLTVWALAVVGRGSTARIPRLPPNLRRLTLLGCRDLMDCDWKSIDEHDPRDDGIFPFSDFQRLLENTDDLRELDLGGLSDRYVQHLQEIESRITHCQVVVRRIGQPA